ncbi:MAG: sensor histidine kinase [Flavobacteriales bacterium]
MKEKEVVIKLIKIALLTAPLIALFTFTPNLIESNLPDSLPTHTPPFGKLIGMLFLTFVIFVLWLMNIGWYLFFKRREHFFKYYRLYRYIASFISCFIFLALILNLPPPPHVKSIPSPGLMRIIIPFIGIMANNAILLIIMDLVVLRDKKTKMEIEISDLTLNNVMAQNEQLKGQIHPHFLFNSLATLKTLMKVSHSDAEKYLINLSSYLRAAISYSGENKASLKDELKHCIEYLEMQKVRFGNSLNYEISIPEGIQKDVYLPVFSLQMLAENAIKHNSLTKESPLTITISLIDKNTVEVKNNLNLKLVVNSTGLGLDNLSKRVKLLSNAEKDIDIQKTEQYFCVTIPLIEK